MGALITKPNVSDPDRSYQMLMDMNAGCSDKESELRNAKLILALVNHIGDEGILGQAIAVASGASADNQCQT